MLQPPLLCKTGLWLMANDLRAYSLMCLCFGRGCHKRRCVILRGFGYAALAGALIPERCPSSSQGEWNVAGCILAVKSRWSDRPGSSWWLRYASQQQLLVLCPERGIKKSKDRVGH